MLSLIFVRSISDSQGLGAIRDALNSTKLLSIAVQLSYLFSSVSSSSNTNGTVYLVLLLIVISLAIIWALRQMQGKNPVSAKQSFYVGMTPFVPFVLVILVINIQMLPMTIGGFLYNAFVVGGIATTGLEQFSAVAIVLALILWSMYMVCASIFALYIVTLPGMTPLRALKSAKKLVYKRRLLLWRKLLFMPITVTLFVSLFEIPVIAFATVFAPWTFLVLSALALPFAHTYVYSLYREMLISE